MLLLPWVPSTGFFVLTLGLHCKRCFYCLNPTPRRGLWTAIANNTSLLLPGIFPPPMTVQASDPTMLGPLLEPLLIGSVAVLWVLIAGNIVLHHKTYFQLPRHSTWCWLLELCAQLLGLDTWLEQTTIGSCCCFLVIATWGRVETLKHHLYSILCSLGLSPRWTFSSQSPCHYYILLASQSHSGEPLRPKYNFHGMPAHASMLDTSATALANEPVHQHAIIVVVPSVPEPG